MREYGFNQTNIKTFNEQAIASSLNRLHEQGLLDQNFQSTPAIKDIITKKALRSGHLPAIIEAIRTVLPFNEDEFHAIPQQAARRCFREILFAIYAHDVDSFHKHLLIYFEEEDQESSKPNPVLEICNAPFDPDWFADLPYQIQFYALHEILKDSLLRLRPIQLQLQFLKDREPFRAIPAHARPSFYYLLIAYLLLCGETSAASQYISGAQDEISSFGLSAWLDFLLGRNEKAIKQFEEDLAQLRKANKNNGAYFTGPEGLFFILSMLKSGKVSFYSSIKKQILTTIPAIQPHNIFLPAYEVLLAVVEARENNLLPFRNFFQLHRSNRLDSIALLFAELTRFWIEGELTARDIKQLKTYYARARDNGYAWLAMEYALLLHNATSEQQYLILAEEVQNQTQMQSVSPMFRHEEAWQRALKALNRANLRTLPYSGQLLTSRLAWRIKYDEDSGEISIYPKEQRLAADGNWTTGRAVALKRLYNSPKPEFLSDQDLQVFMHLHCRKDQLGTRYHFVMEKALPALVGHPYLFLEDSPTVPVDIIEGEPELLVEEKNGRIHVDFFPATTEKKVIIVQETPTCFKIIELSEEHHRIATIIGPNGLDIPADAKDDLLAALGNISSYITVHSTINGRSTGICEVPADPRIHILLLPYGTGFKLSMHVRPFGNEGPYQKPGKGKEILMAKIDDRHIQTCRDLTHEEEQAKKVEAACPELLEISSIEREWLLHDPEDCLQVLHDLQSLGDSVVVEWPEGEKLSVSPQATMQQLYVNIRKRQNWFEISGQLQLDESLVLDMGKLLELARSSPSRFIPLGNGQFLTLTNELRKRLDEYNTFAEHRQGKLRIHPLAALALAELTDESEQLQADKHWHAQMEQLKNISDFHPAIPSTLQAELRDYQIEGYRWLARLAHWGVGACLADDMGLGKTVQALALLLTRAPQGPALVIAPTSVCLNWQEEANRFAPTLNIIFFESANREKLVNNLKEFDVLVTSYGLLQQASDILASREWETIVLDEAQAIKNFVTKRSRAAMNLKGKFKLITTGTPIENHLYEFWNLFNFINPGLLGSLKQFNERFALPIEKHKSLNTRNKLKKLTQPFILRRLKSQVLEELPPKTEILLQVEMHQKEAAFYEALRREALEKLSKPGRRGPRNIQILAEIMRLRRACCNTRLIVPESTIPSSKLEVFGKLIDELLENRHKALVFSQFVSHLSIIREYLDARNLPYRYLDGSTPAWQRSEEVNKFQSGEGSFFLISLKAGGTGLNLTAADYVIHMDPWWNPAVEDQASDRAHRIGQMHPVTIYRLVTKGTIEEKIVQLHQEKKELADSLLDGTDLSENITADDLLRLLRDR